MIQLETIDFQKCERYSAGSGAYVYKIGDKILKIPKRDYFGVLEREFEIQKQLFEAGINVARPYGIFEVSNTDFSEFTFKENRGLLMDFIDGPKIDEIPDQMRPKFARAYELELKKCKKLGFVTSDDGYHNGMYSPERGVCLIDFETWGIDPTALHT